MHTDVLQVRLYLRSESLQPREALRLDVYLMRLSLWIWRWGSLLMATEGIGIEMV